MRYPTRYFHGRETGGICDDASMLTEPLRGNRPAALSNAMQDSGLSRGPMQFMVADG